MSLQPYSKKELNFFKFASLVLNEFPKALRQIFVAMWDKRIAPLPGYQPWDDSIAVRNMLLNTEGRKTKIPTNTSFEEWDCTALFQATLYAKTFDLPDSKGNMKTLNKMFLKNLKLAHGQFHSTVTSPSGNPDETIALAIDQLRLLRNTLCHSSSSCVDKVTFDLYLQCAKEAFTAVKWSTKSLEAIGNLAESDFPTTKVQALKERIEKERKLSNEFLQSEVKDKLDGIEEILKSEVKDELHDIKLITNVTKNQVEETNKNVAEIQKKLEELSATKDLKDQTTIHSEEPKPEATLFNKPVDVLLLTTDDVEFGVAQKILSNPKSEDAGEHHRQLCFGEIGRNKVALFKWSSTTGVPEAQALCAETIEKLKPKAIVGLGVCSGTKKNEHNLGDVLVSAQVHLSDGSTNRPRSTFDCSLTLTRLFDCGKFGWSGPCPEVLVPKVHVGQVISAPQDIDNTTHKDKPRNLFPQAIGVDTEDEGLSSTIQNSKVPWVFCKSVTNWVDGNNNSRWHPFGAAVSTSYVEHVLKKFYIPKEIQDAREEAHIRSFTKWVNSKVSKIQPKVHISELSLDLRDGLVLISLLEVLIHNKLPREKGKLRVHHVSNVEIVFKTLEKEKIKLHGISAQAIVDGNLKSTLALVWSIILHYQVHGVLQEEPHPSQNDAAEEKPRRKISEVAVEEKLLRWVQGAVEGYDDVVQVNDLSKSWCDGMAFNLLIHVHRNNLLELEDVERMSNKDRLDHAFNVADQHLHVQKLLEPSDVDQANPDKKLVMMYVSSLYQALRQYEPVKRAKRRKVVEETMMAVDTSIVESAPPESSETFLQFKGSLVQVSTSVQKTESDYALVEKSLENRIDVKAWEEYEIRFRSVQADVQDCREEGKKALMDNSQVSKTEADEIRSDLKALETRWSTLESRTEFRRKRLDAKRDESELDEKHKVDEWIRKFELLLKQMTKIKGTIVKIASIQNISEKHRHLQDCVQVVETIQPEYQNAVKCAEEVLLNDACPDWEKSQVKDDVELLKTTWTGVLEDIDAEQESINDTEAEAANVQIEKIQKWREVYKEVDKWYQMMSAKVEGNFTMGKTLSVVREQIAAQEKLSNEIVMTHETVEFLLDDGQELLQNPNTPEPEKNKLRKDIANLVERWESLSGPVNNRLQRLSDMENHLKENLTGKLEEWTNQVTSVEGCRLTREEKKFQVMGGIAPNLEAAMKQKPRAETMAKEMKQEKNKLSGVLRLGDEIVADASLSEEDTAKLQQELSAVQNRWEALDEKINWRIKRLDETISKFGSQQEDKLGKWRENAAEISDWLDKAQLRLAERRPIGSDLKSVSSRKDEFQSFLDDSLTFQRHIYEFTEFSENLRTDPCISKEERIKVLQKTESLKERWDVIVKQINSHHNA